MKRLGFQVILLNLLVLLLALPASAARRGNIHQIPAPQANKEVNSAGKDLEKAYADYYKELKKRPGASDAERESIRKQTVEPAAQRLSDATAKQSAEIRAIDRSGKHTRKHTPEQKDKLHKLHRLAAKGRAECKKDPAKCQDKNAKGKGAPESAAGGSSGKKGPVIDNSGPSRPTVVLDGSNIPREVEFGKKKAPQPPKPASDGTKPSQRK